MSDDRQEAGDFEPKEAKEKKVFRSSIKQNLKEWKEDVKKLRTAKKRLLVLAIIFVALLFLAVIIPTLLNKEKTSQSQYGQSAEEVQVVNRTSGAVNIEVSASEELGVLVKKSYLTNEPKVDVEVVGTQLNVIASCKGFRFGKCQSDLTISVPPGVIVDAKSGRGKIDIGQVRSLVKANSSTGDIHLNGTVGDVEVNTSSGSVRGHELLSRNLVSKSKNGNQSIKYAQLPVLTDLKSSTGSLVVVLPETNEPISIEAATSGRIEIDQMNKVQSAPNQIKAMSKSGFIAVGMR